MEEHPDDLRGDVSHAAEQASRTIDRVSRATRPAVERIASRAHTAVDTLADATCQMADTLGRKSEELMNAEARMVTSTRSVIAANPITAIAIAVAVGAMLSRMTSPR